MGSGEEAAHPSARSRSRLRLPRCRILLPGRDKPFQVIAGLNRWIPFTCPPRAQQLPLLIPDDRIGTIGPPVTLRYESDDELWGITPADHMPSRRLMGIAATVSFALCSRLTFFYVVLKAPSRQSARDRSWRSRREVSYRSSTLLLHCNHSCGTPSLRLLCGNTTDS